jgi:hypothetical protein
MAVLTASLPQIESKIQHMEADLDVKQKAADAAKTLVNELDKEMKAVQAEYERANAEIVEKQVKLETAQSTKNAAIQAANAAAIRVRNSATNAAEPLAGKNANAASASVRNRVSTASTASNGARGARFASVNISEDNNEKEPNASAAESNANVESKKRTFITNLGEYKKESNFNIKVELKRTLLDQIKSIYNKDLTEPQWGNLLTYSTNNPQELDEAIRRFQGGRRTRKQRRHRTRKQRFSRSSRA